MSKKKETSTKELTFVKQKGGIREFVLTSNGMRVLYVPRKGTGVVTTEIVYTVGSRDEIVGETGLAHMLEHMLFKPTRADHKRRHTLSEAMLFEKEVGVRLNANTWKDRTAYYFVSPKREYERALRCEAERMQGVILTDDSFIPERNNVLSEYDMYAGDEHFLVSVALAASAFTSHPYKNEVIGFRDDIASLTTDMLRNFYEKHYNPSSATLIVIGDVTERELSASVVKYFSPLKDEVTGVRKKVVEPKQKGIRRVILKHPTPTEILGIGIKHEGFPTKEWYETSIALHLLAGDEESILYKACVDTGLLSEVHYSIEPTYDTNCALLSATLAQGTTHHKAEKEILTVIRSLTVKEIRPYVKKALAHALTDAASIRESSESYAHALVEYVSAGAWESIIESEKIIGSLTAESLHKRILQLFDEDVLTIVELHGTKK